MSLWTDWLSETPSAQYYGSLGQAGMSPFMRRYFSNQYQPIYNQFMGALGGQVMQGQTPDMTFGGFMGNYPWMKEFSKLPGWQQGMNKAWSPRSKWLVY